MLKEQGFPSDLVWIFDENLCFEKEPTDPAGLRLSFQTVFSPPPPDAEHIAYEHFSDVDAPLVWYRLGSCRGRSVCSLLCDPWFQNKSQSDGFFARPNWLMMFRPGPKQEIEEITERPRWENRQMKGRPLQDLDFCMSLRAVHETLAHGRVLTAYERYALKLLHVWRHWLGSQP